MTKHNKLLLMLLLALMVLVFPLTSVHARRDPFTTAVRTGGSGPGDGTVTFTIGNINDATGLVSLQVTETDNNGNAIQSVDATPTNWVDTSIVFKNGKAVQTTWQTCVSNSGCAPVAPGTFLGGFSVKMNGQCPYGWNWVLTDQAGATFSGNLNVCG